MSRISLSFAKCHPDAKLPIYKTEGSVGADICALEEVIVEGNSRVTKVRTGLIAIIPPVYNCHWEICLRSGFGFNHPGVVLSNGIGIIDADFQGPTDEICVLLCNTSMHDTVIKAGERIAQLVLRETIKPEITEISMEEVEKKYKSRGGFGSTGQM